MSLGVGDIVRDEEADPPASYVVLKVIPLGAQSETVIVDSDQGDRLLLKRFLKPKWPSSDRGPALRAAQEAGCRSFADHHLAIHDAIDEPREGGGNVVLATAFFRSGPYFHKTYPFVESVTFPVDASSRQRLVFTRTLAGSLRDFSEAGVVHGDLKPDNVLVKERDGIFIAKIIDYDDAYFASEPPVSPVGSFDYSSPELRDYWRDSSNPSPDSKSDVFSFGVTLHGLLAGRFPEHDRDAFEWPVDSVLAGEPFRAATHLGALADVINSTFTLDTACRPSIDEVIQDLAAVPEDACGTSTPSSAPADAPGTRIVDKRSTLSGPASPKLTATDMTIEPKSGSNLRKGRIYRPLDKSKKE